MTDREIIKRLGLTVPSPPQHFTDGQKAGEERLPFSTRAGIGFGSFMSGCHALVSSLVPGPVSRTGQNFAYGVRMGGVLHQVSSAKKAIEAQKVSKERKAVLTPIRTPDPIPAL